MGDSIDRSESLQEQVRAAITDGAPLRIKGGDSKAFLGRHVEGRVLDTREHCGIVHYDPTELVLTARAGTPLSEIEAALAERNQMLPCEPPHFSDGTTFGGAVAAGLSGPRRPWSGAVRDFVLGCRLIDGHARHLRFGGEVMKNVAGYDLSRLMAGSFGTLALLTEVSIKVLPRPLHTITLKLDLDVAESLRRLAGWASEPLPISGASHDGSALMLRLEGGHGSVEASAARLGGEIVDGPFWSALRDHELPFFAGEQALWRLSLPTHKQLPQSLPGTMLIDWAGAQIWLRSDADTALIRERTAALGGHATRWRGATDIDSPFHPLPAPLLALQQRLKAQLDPQGLFNPGRLYSGL
jgi:glycolate oxidase FAD binding subunit